MGHKLRRSLTKKAEQLFNKALLIFIKHFTITLAELTAYFVFFYTLYKLFV